MQLACEPELASKMSPEALLQDIEVGGLQRSDEELVIAAQNGDSCALGELLGRHQKLLFCVARRYTANAEEAHDLVQEAMFRAIRNIGRFRGESRFVTWLSSIVINQAISNKRREKHISWIALDEHEGEETRFCIRSLRDVRRNPEEDFSHRELRGLLRREALKLHPKYRFILIACDLDECSIEEVARLQGIHLGAAKSRLYRARLSLSAAIKKLPSARHKYPHRAA
jgi:RNA polymerase sigma-70 factor (ECF subfamily)